MFSLRSSLCLVFTIFLGYQLFRARFSSEKKYTIDTLSILISLFYVVSMFFLLVRDTVSLKQIHMIEYSSMLYVLAIAGRLARYFQLACFLLLNF
jgi:hypothetical protein